MEWQAGERGVRVPVGEKMLDGNLTAARKSDWRGAVRSRQRQQPAQPPQSLRRAGAQRGGAADSAGRPAHPG